MTPFAVGKGLPCLVSRLGLRSCWTYTHRLRVSRQQVQCNSLQLLKQSNLKQAGFTVPYLFTVPVHRSGLCLRPPPLAPCLC